jgi:hypothetical protein
MFLQFSILMSSTSQHPFIAQIIDLSYSRHLQSELVFTVDNKDLTMPLSGKSYLRETLCTVDLLVQLVQGGQLYWTYPLTS